MELAVRLAIACFVSSVVACGGAVASSTSDGGSHAQPGDGAIYTPIDTGAPVLDASVDLVPVFDASADVDTGSPAIDSALPDAPCDPAAGVTQPPPVPLPMNTPCTGNATTTAW